MATRAKPFLAQEFLGLGLTTANYPNWNNYLPHTQLYRFRKHFGVSPQTVADCWRMLRDSDDDDIRLEKNAKPMHLLLACRFLWKYDTEYDLGSFFSIKSPKTVGKWCRDYVGKMSKLLAGMMGSLDDNDHGLIYIMSIDGVHCRIWEPRPWSRKWSSHKFGKKPGVNYELGVSLWEPKLIWIYGPTPPGTMTDLVVFQSLLKGCLPQGKKVVADGIYASEKEHCVTKNDLDPVALRNFKNRASARQENYNQRLKCFKVLDVPYRHGVHVKFGVEAHIPHQNSMYACCVLTELQLANGSTHLLDPWP